MWSIYMFYSVVALVLGSFFNVVAIRLLKQESIMFPPSHCPHCHHQLKIIDLIPLISFLLLRGKCRYCQTSISKLYPFGEALTVCVFLLILHSIGFHAELLPALFLMTVLILSVLTDIQKKLILNAVTFPAIGIACVLRLFIGEEPFWSYFMGGLIGFTLLFLIAIISKGGIGGGDIKLFAVIGLILGTVSTLMSFIFAVLSAAAIGLILLLFGRVKRHEPIAFAPYILLGVVLTYSVGETLWNWYMNLF